MDQQRMDHLDHFEEKMTAAGLAPLVIDTFAAYYRQVVAGQTGIIPDDAIRPPREDEVVHAETLPSYADAGRAALKHAVRITLNGGLGTSMGFDRAQIPAHRQRPKIIPGNHFRTVGPLEHQAGLHEQLQHPGRHGRGLEGGSGRPTPPLMFIQNRFPKILQDSLMPVSWPSNPELEMEPARAWRRLHGHGHVRHILDHLLEADIRYALICNSDNLGATMDEPILGYLVRHDVPFLMEVARRTPADAKGGHLAVDGKK